MLHFIFLCSIDAFSKEFHAGDICGGNCMVVPQFDKFDEENPEVKKEYWDNGKLKREVHLKNGKPEGLETWWYESGEKNLQTHYKNGKENGVRKV